MAVPIGNVYNGWGTIALCAAIGILGASLTLCDKKTRQVALDLLSSITPKSMKWGKRLASEQERSKLTVKMIQTAKLRKQLPLVSGKKMCKLPGGARVHIRETAPNGDCFFLCAAIGLLEFLQKNKTHLSHIIEVIETDSSLLPEDKEQYVRYITYAAFAEDEDDLSVIFENNEIMNQLVLLLRCLMGSALEEEPEITTEDGPFPKVLSKEDFYAEVIGSLDEDPDSREEYPESAEFSLEGFQKIVRLLRYSFAWPSDACIRALCLKLNIGFSIFKHSGARLVKQTCIENLPSAGDLLLQGDHYSKIYIPSQFSITRSDFRNKEGESVKAIEIKSPAEDVFFLGISVALLDFLYKNKGFQSVFDSIEKLSPACIEIMDRARKATSEFELQNIFTDHSSMRKMTSLLRFLVKDHLQEDLFVQAEALFKQLNLFMNVGIEKVAESGEFSVIPVFSAVENEGLLLLQGDQLASFFPKK